MSLLVGLFRIDYDKPLLRVDGKTDGMKHCADDEVISSRDGGGSITNSRSRER